MRIRLEVIMTMNPTSIGAAGVLPVAVVRLTAPPMLVGFIVMMTSSLILM